MAPTKSARDWMVKISMGDHSGYEGSGAPFRFFNASEQKLPPFGTECGSGDVAIIRNMKVKTMGGSVMGLTNNFTDWVIINGHSLRTIAKDKLDEVPIIRRIENGSLPTTAELLYAQDILELVDPITIKGPAPRIALEIRNTMMAAGAMAPKLKDKFSLIKDLMPPTDGEKVFKDLFGEVRRMFKRDTRIEIKVTDYTSHDMLYDHASSHAEEGPDGDSYGYVQDAAKVWPGPHGKKTIMVTLWDAHAKFAHRALCEGNYVLLKNVHLTMDRNSTLLEGHCRGDKMNMEKVNVTIVRPVEADNNEHLRDLLKRKRDIGKAEGAKFARDPTNLKRRAEAMSEVVNEQTVSGNAARNKKGERKSAKDIKKEAHVTEESDGRESNPSLEKGALFSTNTEVRILKVDVPCKPVYQILDPDILARKTAKGNTFYLPFQNCRYKSKVRVVDFFPNDIADFAGPYRASDYGMLSDQDDSDFEVDTTQVDDYDVKWKWRFFLVVEDASRPAGQEAARMELLVCDQEGDYLFNTEACNLRKNPEVLARIREKLFVLWGDLLELKEEASRSQEVAELKLRALPFECLIAEYGIEARDIHGVKEDNGEYDRVFHLHGTTVK